MPHLQAPNSLRCSRCVRMMNGQIDLHPPTSRSSTKAPRWTLLFSVEPYRVIVLVAVRHPVALTSNLGQSKSTYSLNGHTVKWFVRVWASFVELLAERRAEGWSTKQHWAPWVCLFALETSWSSRAMWNRSHRSRHRNWPNCSSRYQDHRHWLRATLRLRRPVSP